LKIGISRYDTQSFARLTDINSVRQEGEEYNEWLSYAQSKTGNVLFTAALAEKLKSKGVQSFALQPGCTQY
jgi:NAD(P)-dependent dehydrogenase (short-subunit alcohol dehydrogenase family)